MLFNSLQFLVFLAVVLALTFAIPRLRWQNAMLLVASYVFYGAWDWRFLGLILLSTVIDFLCGQAIDRSPGQARKRLILGLSLAVNLGMLGLFKYWDFGIESMAVLLEGLGLQANLPALRLILPVGISFYTFQTISYTVDVYRGVRPAVREPLDFALYVAFFPQLVAGPIERSTTLLPQLQRARRVTLEDWKIGLSWMALGYFKKVALADTLAPLVEHAFRQTGEVNGTVVLLASFAFAVQLYGDFAGYSLIARGVARLMGIHIIRNFNAPYLAGSPREIWHRWHISLSRWLREYLYFALGGSRSGKWKTYRNLLLTMVLGGLWHGAGWNFVLWGAYHGLFLCADHAISGGRKEQPRRALPVRVLQVLGTFLIMCGGYLIFLSQGLDHLGLLLQKVLFEQGWNATASFYLWPALTGFCLLMAFHLVQEYTRDELVLFRAPWWIQTAVYTFLLTAVLVVGFRPQPFFYFQF